MPSADDLFDNDDNDLSVNMRLLCYGEEKTKKTWWACKAAEAGFNVLLIDADDGYHIIKQISPAARKRIHILRVADTLTSSSAATFLTLFLKGNQFDWDEGNNCLVNPMPGQIKPDVITRVNPRNVDKGWVIVIDSWTALSTSLIKAWYYENDEAIDKADRHDRPCYGYASSLATYWNSQIKALSKNTNVVVIGHKTVYEKYKTVSKPNGKKEQVPMWSKDIVKSTSGPHGMTVGADYSDILYFELRGTNFFIDTAKKTDRPGGCRMIPPDNYPWDKLDFATFCRTAGVELPKEPSKVSPIQLITAASKSPAAASTAPVIQQPAGIIKLSN